jgi:hypothetical protein
MTGIRLCRPSAPADDGLPGVERAPDPKPGQVRAGVACGVLDRPAPGRGRPAARRAPASYPPRDCRVVEARGPGAERFAVGREGCPGWAGPTGVAGSAGAGARTVPAPTFNDVDGGYADVRSTRPRLRTAAGFDDELGRAVAVRGGSSGTWLRSANLRPAGGSGCMAGGSAQPGRPNRAARGRLRTSSPAAPPTRRCTRVGRRPVGGASDAPPEKLDSAALFARSAIGAVAPKRWTGAARWP